MIQGLRLPRIRDVMGKQEVPFLRSERGEYRLAEMLLASTLGGMWYRKVVSWARHHLGLVISTAWVGRVVEAAAERIERRRQERFTARQFEALVVDAVWVHYRRSPRRRTRSGALLVAVGVEFGGSFRVLDWQVAEQEDREAYQALLQRLYQRGLEEVPLIVADGCGSVRAAAEIVYPQAQLQPCLRHWLKALEGLLLCPASGPAPGRFSYWWDDSNNAGRFPGAAGWTGGCRAAGSRRGGSSAPPRWRVHLDEAAASSPPRSQVEGTVTSCWL
jgi:hypothetical protein